MTCPPVMKRMLKVTNMPRNADGESSEMYLVTNSQHGFSARSLECVSPYRGTTRLAPPTARPTMLLPMIIPATLPVTACHKAPTAKSTSATKMTDFLPRRSASTLASGLAIRAKRLVEDVIKLLSRVDIGRDRSEPMDTRVADITPVLAEGISLS